MSPLYRAHWDTVRHAAWWGRPPWKGSGAPCASRTPFPRVPTASFAREPFWGFPPLKVSRRWAEVAAPVPKAAGFCWDRPLGPAALTARPLATVLRVPPPREPLVRTGRFRLWISCVSVLGLRDCGVMENTFK